MPAIDSNNSPKPPTGGCGMSAIYLSFFRRRSFWRNRTTSTSRNGSGRSSASAPTSPSNSVTSSKRCNGSNEAPVAVPSNLGPQLASKAPKSNIYKSSPRRGPENPKALAPLSNGNKGIEGELDAMIAERQRGKGGNLMRVSSGNVMVHGNLGNLRVGNSGKDVSSRDVLNYLPKTAKELRTEANSKKENCNGVSGNIQNVRNVVKGAGKMGQGNTGTTAAAPELCRALSRRLEPEELKELGNGEYKNGRFAEALAYYDRAIVMDPRKASYYSNKAAALIGLEQLLEAIGECKEAIRIDPAYYRAHCRLGTVYIRIGEAEKAIHHFKLSRNEASPKDISRAQTLQTHLAKSNEARKLKDYVTLLKESQAAVSIGADSSPQVFALQAEALLKLDRHDEADSILNAAPKFDTNELTKVSGAMVNAYFHIVKAQVDMAAGRFENAVSLAQKATLLDPSSRDISGVFRRTKAVVAARLRGNELYKASKFAEACIAYGEGLNHDMHNAILLCNRAACRSKLGQYEKAIEDCNTALVVRPSHSKARLRRADCNAKLEKWEAAIKDYGVLARELPGDEEVSKALSEAQEKLKRQRDAHMKVTD